MQILVLAPRRRAALAACAAAALASPAAAHARPVTAALRVEAGGTSLAPGDSYVTDGTRLQTDQRPGCDGSGAVKSIGGPSALGIVDSASRIDRGLRPFAVSDKFSFGLFVCGIGSFGPAHSGFWLYKVDHKSPEVGADHFPLKGGELVLWYLQDAGAKSNTGDELALVAPARARPGRAFTVRVLAYDARGRARPVAGALVLGASVQRTDEIGNARVFSDRQGLLRLRAVHDSDIRSSLVGVCVKRVLRRCPPVRGERILGTAGADRIVGTRGADLIEAGGGRDRIDVRGGGRDRVRCGRGRDSVRADRGDRIARDCERIRRG
jgi:hypothetical protein